MLLESFTTLSLLVPPRRSTPFLHQKASTIELTFNLQKNVASVNRSKSCIRIRRKMQKARAIRTH